MTKNASKAWFDTKYLELVGPISIFIALTLLGTALTQSGLRWMGAVGIVVFAAGQYFVNWIRMRRMGFGSALITRPTKIVDRPKTKRRFEQQNRHNHTARTFGIMVGGFPVLAMLWSYPYVVKSIKINHLSPLPVLIGAAAVLLVCSLVSWWSLIMAQAIAKGDNFIELLPEGIKIYCPAGLGAFRDRDATVILWENLVAAKLNPGLWPWGFGLEIIARDTKNNEARIWLLNSLMFNVKEIHSAIADTVPLNGKGIADKKENDI